MKKRTVRRPAVAAKPSKKESKSEILRDAVDLLLQIETEERLDRFQKYRDSERQLRQFIESTKQDMVRQREHHAKMMKQYREQLRKWKEDLAATKSTKRRFYANDRAERRRNRETGRESFLLKVASGKVTPAAA